MPFYYFLRSERSLISVVLPVYNEREALNDIYLSLSNVMRALDEPYEMIFVDDGSTDGSAAILADIGTVDTQVRVVKFDRNYGQSSAIQAGLDHAAGNVLVTLDADLENDPGDIPLLIEKLQSGFDVVCGNRDSRPRNRKTRCSILGNSLYRVLFNSPVHDMACTLRAYRKTALDDLVLRGTMHRCLPVLLSHNGVRITEIPVAFTPRQTGFSKYGVFNRIPSFMRDTLLLMFFRNRVMGNRKRRYRIEDMDESSR